MDFCPGFGGFNRGKNNNVPQNNIKNPIFFVAHVTPNECLTEVSSHILNFDGVGEWEEPGGGPGHSILPTLPTSWLREPTLQKIFGFEFYIPISNNIIYLVYSVLAFLWFFLYCYAWTIAVFTTNPSIETGQQSDKKKKIKKFFKNYASVNELKRKK